MRVEEEMLVDKKFAACRGDQPDRHSKECGPWMWPTARSTMKAATRPQKRRAKRVEPRNLRRGIGKRQTSSFRSTDGGRVRVRRSLRKWGARKLARGRYGHSRHTVATCRGKKCTLTASACRSRHVSFEISKPAYRQVFSDLPGVEEVSKRSQQQASAMQLITAPTAAGTWGAGHAVRLH